MEQIELLRNIYIDKKNRKMIKKDTIIYVVRVL